MGVKIISSFKELEKILESKISMALKMTRDEIFETMQRYISEYYKEPVFNGSSIPQIYERTYKLLNSLIKTELVKSGNSYSCKVEIDPLYLNMQYPGDSPLGTKVTGLEVVGWMNNESHGGMVPGGHRYWDEALAELGGEYGIRELMKKNLRECGIHVC